MRIILVCFLLPAVAATAIGALFYPGQLSWFLLFSATFFAVLYSAFVLPFQYSHLFLAIPWFLGFWVKLVVHFAFAHLGWLEAARYVEPAGRFDGSPTAWDQVIITATVGGLGYLVGRLFLAPIARRSSKMTKGIKPPQWYRPMRTPLWMLAAIAFVLIVYVNAETGLIVRGYVPRMQLPWPFGALFAWTTDIGFALVLSVMTAWERGLSKGPTRGFIALCLEGAIVSVQTNSRGIYLFHTVPALVSEARRSRSALSKLVGASLLLGIWLAGAVAIPVLTTGLRALGENAVLARTAQVASPAAAPSTSTTSLNSNTSVIIPRSAEAGAPTIPTNSNRLDPSRSFASHVFEDAGRLVIDRWPGLEGLMATQSYPARSLELLKSAAFQRRTFGMVDIYSHAIAGLDFTEEQAKKYHNATLAGPMAFFYYSGSWLFVFAGMALLAILISVLELIWASLVSDPLVVAMSGCYLALVVMQLSTGVLQAASGPLAVTILLVLVWVISRMRATPVKVFPEQAKDVA
jgi:hypothetical protein